MTTNTTVNPTVNTDSATAATTALVATETAHCAALFIAAPASGQGKTTVTAALARFFTKQGKKVQVFKTGPDYLDPQILAQASGCASAQLDLWMAGEQYCRQMLYEAAQKVDLILIEGAMGLFDGEPSSADLAAKFSIPIAIVMDVKGMAQTAAAVALGLANYRSDYQCAGLIANNCGSERHAQLIREALNQQLPLLACLAKDPDVSLPERHLGLVQASEVAEELELRFEKGCAWLEQGVHRAATDDALLKLPAKVAFTAGNLDSLDKIDRELLENSTVTSQPLAGKTIAIAKDAAFSFIYQANLDILEKLGAKLKYFSPLVDRQIPEADGLWLPGGYPELHARQLSENHLMRAQMQRFQEQRKPILAECGGFLYCLAGLTDLDGEYFLMANIMQGEGAMRGKRGCQGMQTAILPEGEVRGHAHHRSRSSGTKAPIGYGKRQRHPAPGEAIFREANLTASYLHLFFASNPSVIAKLFNGELQAPNQVWLDQWQAQ
ncbi:MAG: cobyrinic acid a,c-diamide synthase [Osedax symbiont Rs1]|nr:MAG: cobyrinic acid a,c-diamide synthase [Osedax symbiont Rs1]